MIDYKAVNSDETYEERVEYNSILDRNEKEDWEDWEWHFFSIDGHQGPLNAAVLAYKGSRWNVQLTWENGKERPSIDANQTIQWWPII